MSEGQIKKHLLLPSVLMQCRDILGKLTSGMDLSIGQNTDTHGRRKLMTDMVLKCKCEAMHGTKSILMKEEGTNSIYTFPLFYKILNYFF